MTTDRHGVTPSGSPPDDGMPRTLPGRGEGPADAAADEVVELALVAGQDRVPAVALLHVASPRPAQAGRDPGVVDHQVDSGFELGEAVVRDSALAAAHLTGQHVAGALHQDRLAPHPR